MLSRLKRSLVESYVGAVAVGGVFAWGILDFVSIFSAPLTSWVARSELREIELPEQRLMPGTLLWRDAAPYVASSVGLLLVGYLLMRWLYFKPLAESDGENPRPE